MDGTAGQKGKEKEIWSVCWIRFNYPNMHSVSGSTVCGDMIHLPAAALISEATPPLYLTILCSSGPLVIERCLWKWGQRREKRNGLGVLKVKHREKNEKKETVYCCWGIKWANIMKIKGLDGWEVKRRKKNKRKGIVEQWLLRWMDEKVNWREPRSQWTRKKDKRT